MLSTIIERLNEKRHDEIEEGMEADAGFTLIELMVVLLIMAILLAIAIPTFLGVKGGAQDRAAQSNLQTALTNAKAIYGNNQSYGTPAATAAEVLLSSAEPSLTFVTDPTASTDQNHISVLQDQTGNGIMLVNKSAGGDCWGIFTNEATTEVGNPTAWPVTNAAGTYYISYSGTCSADVAVGKTVNAAGMTTPGNWTVNAFTSAK